MKYQNLIIFPSHQMTRGRYVHKNRDLATTQLIYFLLHFLLMFLLPRFMIFLIKEDYKVIAVGQRQFYCLIKKTSVEVKELINCQHNTFLDIINFLSL